MQLQWEQKAGPATEQLLVWACKYTVYNGQYDVSLSTSPEIAAMDEKCTNTTGIIYETAPISSA